MWTNINKILFISIIFAATEGQALKCYVCNSAYDEHCESNPPEKYLVECTPQNSKPLNNGASRKISSELTTNFTNNSTKSKREERVDSSLNSTLVSDPHQVEFNFTMCRKDDFYIQEQENGEHFHKDAKKIIYRSCGWIGEPETFCKTSPSDTITMYQCSCIDNACNSSCRNFISWIFSISSTFIFLMRNVL